MEKNDSHNATNTMTIDYIKEHQQNKKLVQELGNVLLDDDLLSPRFMSAYFNESTNIMIKPGILEQTPTSTVRKKFSKLSPGSHPKE